MELPGNSVYAARQVHYPPVMAYSWSTTKRFGFAYISPMMLDVCISLLHACHVSLPYIIVSEAYMNGEISSPSMKDVLNVSLRVFPAENATFQPPDLCRQLSSHEWSLVLELQYETCSRCRRAPFFESWIPSIHTQCTSISWVANTN